MLVLVLVFECRNLFEGTCVDMYAINRGGGIGDVYFLHRIHKYADFCIYQRNLADATCSVRISWFDLKT